MNISRIRHMAYQGDMSADALRFLLNCHGECEHLDFKEELDLENDYGCACFSRDVLAMKNVGGGFLAIGVKDKTWEPVGLDKRLAYDTKLLRDKVRKCTGQEIETDVVQHEISLEGSQKLFALILIRSAIKRSKLRVPTLCSTDFHPKEKWGLRRGGIYVRDGDQTKCISSSEELEQLLDDLETRYQEAEIAQASSLPSPFAVETGLYRLLPCEYETFVGRERYKSLLSQAVEGDPRLWIINLHGPGGVGKSALASWLAYKCYQEQQFESILHLSAKDLELSVEQGICRLTPTLFSLEDFLDRVLHLFSHEEYCLADLEKRKEVGRDVLVAFPTLLILDNMETVKDGRIMEFVRGLPPSRTKVLLTSRRRTSEWEYPIQVAEFDVHEVEEFLHVRTGELGLDLPWQRPDIVQRISDMSGGLPLAIQWILGEYARSRDLDKILSRTLDPDSPLLEFSFRNSWNALDDSAQQALAVLTVFEEPPTAQVWRTALNWPLEKLERAIEALIGVTFVNERTDPRTGSVIYSALPITLAFARNEFGKMGDVERQARLRYQEYRNIMDLASVETGQYGDLFQRFDATADTQKRAIILCRMAEGQARSLGYKTADQYYQQALTTDPRSVYALVSYALFKMELGNIGEAIGLMEQAEQRCTNRTGYYVYFNWAKVYDVIRDRSRRAWCLRKALQYESDHTIAKHSLGVALSQDGQYDEALRIFDSIIQEELAKPNGPSDSLVYALKTKIITLRRAGRGSTASSVLKEALDMVRSRQEVRHLAHKLEEEED
jgi:tetratricopeptide (TPR) repeat protein